MSAPEASSPAPSTEKSASKEDVKNRGWPKGKKRYPKSPGAPKQPLSGYVHFLNDRREIVRKENPDISFADISKKLAIEWGQVSAKIKQEYVEKAEADKERYNKEFSAYQQTQEYKDFIAEQNEKGLADKAKKVKKEDSKKSKKDKAAAAEVVPKKELVEEPPQQTIDIPIFTEEFLEHNKAKESELRQLRKQANEFEEQNAILQKHVENMRSAITKLEHETLQQQESNAALAKHLESLRRLVVSHFAGTHLSPQRKEPLTLDNVDAYMQELRTIVIENPKEHESLVAKARDIASRMNYDTLTSNL